VERLLVDTGEQAPATRAEEQHPEALLCVQQMIAGPMKDLRDMLMLCCWFTTDDTSWTCVWQGL
jgi:hypothetical protein